MTIAFPPKGRLHHGIPAWVRDGSVFHIRIRSDHKESRPLTEASLARSIIDSVRKYHDDGRWWCRLFLLMPDHLHALLSLPRDNGMSSIVRQWKSYHARINQVRWQDGYFDHRIRSDESLDEKAAYIRQNPVVKGLIATEKDWPWVIDLMVLTKG